MGAPGLTQDDINDSLKTSQDSKHAAGSGTHEMSGIRPGIPENPRFLGTIYAKQ